MGHDRKSVVETAHRCRIEYPDGRVEHSRSYASESPAKAFRTRELSQYRYRRGGHIPPKITLEKSVLRWEAVEE